jgi:hypothetical protein
VHGEPVNGLSKPSANGYGLAHLVEKKVALAMRVATAHAP